MSENGAEEYIIEKEQVQDVDSRKKIHIKAPSKDEAEELFEMAWNGNEK